MYQSFENLILKKRFENIKRFYLNQLIKAYFELTVDENLNDLTEITFDAVVSNDAVDTVVPAFKANEAVVANEDDIACEEVIAKLPVIVFPSPSCSSLPLICVRN